MTVQIDNAGYLVFGVLMAVVAIRMIFMVKDWDDLFVLFWVLAASCGAAWSINEGISFL